MPLPIVRATIVAPEPLMNTRAFLRMHNRCAKEALFEQGMQHWKVRIPQHFTRSAHSRYGYQARSAKYMRMKARRYRSVTDLVKRGQMRDEMIKTPPVIRIGGRAADDAGHSAGLKLTLILPFHVGQKAQAYYATLARIGRAQVQAAQARARTRAGVTIHQMRKEVATIRQDEAQQIARGFLKGYGQRLAAGLAAAPRIRKAVRMAKAIAGAGWTIPGS